MKVHTPITIVTDSSLVEHDTGGNEHPEVPERLKAISRQLESGILSSYITTFQPKPASRDQLLSFHTEAWLFRFEEEVLTGHTYIDHPDNQVGYESFNTAMLSAGTGITGIDLLEQGFAQTVFCLTRPPGHHAEPNMPFGFCFFNNCVIAARYWQQLGRTRICVLDFDAHHGNGIQTAFEEDTNTLYISVHEHPSFSYPGTGWAEEHGCVPSVQTVLNLPLQPGAGDEHVLELFHGRIEEILQEFKPQAILVAAGFDAHCRDDMSGLMYTTGLYQEMGRCIKKWEQRFCPGRLLSILEGGYELTSLAKSVEAYLTGLAEKL